ncbi:MAG: NAD(P)/FAD-dependent oxidoreductase, partial [Bacillota bacterium]|nr:NAD(P)/FAD-dependent oxidoreductase [Bacillota bacterium]
VNCGALVYAFNDEDKKMLEELLRRGNENGVPDLKIIDKAEVKRMEPETSDEVVAALYAPSSSIVSPWELCLALAETAVKNGATLFRNAEVTRIEKASVVSSCKNKCGYVVTAGENKIECKYLVNAAGCMSDDIHNMVSEPEFEIIKGRGQYYLLDKEEGTRVSHTIFQCPSKLGKGVLVSPTVHGNLIVGPDSENVDSEDKATTAEGLNFVKKTAARSIPSIDFRQSIRNFAGVRAKTKIDDFIIKKSEHHFIDVAGICSPGLSSAPAIAEYVVELLKEDGLKADKKTDFVCERTRIRFKHLSADEKAKLTSQNPSYGKVVCRCETITEGEILECFNTPIPPVSVDGVKRRVNAGMGRCQGGFCGPTVVDLLAKNLGVDKTQIVKEGSKSWMLSGKVGK